ncbi:MAG TPA: formimidoylglutamase [Bacteroidia bacterium]|jgi:arginase family enzyme
MELTDFLTPIENNFFEDVHPSGNTFASVVKAYTANGFPDLEGVKLGIIGVNDARRSSNENCAAAPDAVRAHLYKLFKGNYELKMVDLGNIKAGHSVEDTYFALRSVVHELLRKQILPIILGGGQDLTYANYLAYENIEATINMVSVDACFDLGEAGAEITSRTWLGKVIEHLPSHLFNFSNIGYQTYFVDPKHIELIDKLYFDAHRLGAVRGSMEDAEPVMRNADMISVDVSCIRGSDAPGSSNATPNGFYGDEICQLMRYAGMSDKLTSIGIYEMDPALDKRGQTAHLVAQMIWCFVDGYCNRKQDFPFRKNTDYLKYHVSLKDLKNEIVFYKSIKSDRWWMEVPYPSDKRLKFERHLLVPCSYNTYKTALEEEMPDQWWQTYQKLSF